MINCLCCVTDSIITTTTLCFFLGSISPRRTSLWRATTGFRRRGQRAFAARRLRPVEFSALLLLLVEVIINPAGRCPVRVSVLLLGAPRRGVAAGRRRPHRYLRGDHKVAAATTPLQLIRGREEVTRVGTRRREPRARPGAGLRAVVRRLLAQLAVEHGLAGRVDGLAQRGGEAVQRAVAQDAAQGALAAPLATGVQGHLAGDVVLVVVHVEAQRAADVVLDDLGEPALAVEDALGGAEDVVAVGEQAGEVGGGVGGDVEDVPDVGDHGEGGPLEGQAERGGVGGDGDVEGAGSLALVDGRKRERRWVLVVVCSCVGGFLGVREGSRFAYLCAPQAEGYHPSGAVSYLLGKEAGARVVLETLRSAAASFSLETASPPGGPYNDSSVDSHDKVEPRLNGKLQIDVSQDLEAEQPLLLFLPGILAIKAGYEAVEGVEHGCHRSRGGSGRVS